MKKSKRFFAVLLALAMVLGMLSGLTLTAGASDAKSFTDIGADANDIIVLYTNDVHGGISDNANLSGSADSLGYAGIAAVKAEAAASAAAVTLVDCGDSIQGSVVDTMSNGEDSLNLMVSLGYDVLVPGNHEFDYGVDTFLAYVEKYAGKLNYICANFTDMDGNTLLPKGYEVLTYNVGGKEIKIAYVGIDTPESISKGTPKDFQDADGNFIYTFDGPASDDMAVKLDQFYSTIQATLDAANAEADYVVALCHLGDDGVVEGWASYDVIANTTGIDVLLDGHSHSTVESAVYKNKDGEDVLQTSTGTKIGSIGCLKLTVTDSGIVPTSALITSITDAEKASDAYTAMAAEVKAVEDKYEYLYEVLGTTSAGLYIKNPETGTRMVRTQDCSMGDFVTDAYLWYASSEEGKAAGFETPDIAFLNGGSIRADIKPGEITYTSCLVVFPWYSHVTEIKVTGQQIVDCLEMGARLDPQECGGFIQAAGLTYDIQMDKESPVVLDSAGMFVSVDGSYADGDYRIANVKVGEDDIDLEKTYILVINNYYYQESGDGMTMFKDSEAIITYDDNQIDVDILASYIKNELKGVIPAEYDNPQGQGRINLISADAPATGDNTIVIVGLLVVCAMGVVAFAPRKKAA